MNKEIKTSSSELIVINEHSFLRAKEIVEQIKALANTSDDLPPIPEPYLVEGEHQPPTLTSLLHACLYAHIHVLAHAHNTHS